MFNARILTFALAPALTSTVAFGQCEQWTAVATPNPSDVINVITASESNAQALHALLIADDSTSVGNPVEYHVLRREADQWTDLGGPELGQLDGPPAYSAMHVDAQGRVWIGGTSEADHDRPIIAEYDGGWLAPQEIDLINQVIYPFYERGGAVYAMDTAPDGTIFAVGKALGYGITGDTSIPLFLVNSGFGWNEVTQHDTDWPGSITGGTRLTDVIAFASDNVWAVGQHAAEDGAYPTGGLIVHWNGSSLSIFEDPRTGGDFLNRPFEAMAANGPDDIWAVGGSPFTPETSTIAHFDGTQWTRIDSPVTHPLRSLALDDDGTAWAAPANPGSDIAYFDGMKWSAVASPNPEELVQTISRDPNGDVWMLGQDSASQSLALNLQCTCAADLTGIGETPDGAVDVDDLFYLLNEWGSCESGCAATQCPADLNGDCQTDVLDLFQLLSAWGACSN